MCALFTVTALGCNVGANEAHTQAVCAGYYERLLILMDENKYLEAAKLSKGKRSCEDVKSEWYNYAYSMEAINLHRGRHHQRLLNLAAEAFEDPRPLTDRTIAVISGSAGSAARRLNREDDAVHYYRIAWYRRDSRIPKNRLILATNYSNILVQLGEYDRARGVSKEAFGLIEQGHGGPHQHINIYSDVASIAVSEPLGDSPVEEARERQQVVREQVAAMRKLLPEVEDDKDRLEEEITARLVEGRAARLVGQLDSARWFATDARQKALRMEREFDIPTYAIMTELLVGEIEQAGGNYEEALSQYALAQRKAEETGELLSLSSALSLQVKVASEVNDEAIAHRAMRQLNQMGDKVPEVKYREASMAYSRAFDSDAAPGSMPTWMLFGIAVGITAALQFIHITARRRNWLPDLDAGPPSAMTLNPEDVASTPAVDDAPVDATPKIASPSELDALLSGNVDPDRTEQVQDESADTPSTDTPSTDTPSAQTPLDDAPDDLSPDELSPDDRMWTEEEAALFRDLGIYLSTEDDTEIEAPHVEPDPKTLEDIFRAALEQQPGIECFRPDGTKAFEIDLSSIAMDGIVRNRFLGIATPGRLIIAYRYNQPQNTVVCQNDDGTLYTEHLDEPVLAVPIAVIETDATAA